jgi:hypothetical protein
MFFDNEELCNFHSLPDIIRAVKPSTMSSTRHVKWVGDMTFKCGVLTEKPESKKPLGRPRYRWIILA